LTVESETAAADTAAEAAAEAAAVSVAATASAGALMASAVTSAAAVVAAAVVMAAEISAAAAVTAAELLQPLPVVYTNFTRPAPFEMIELDQDAFKVEDKYSKLRSDAAARMGKCRAANEFVKTILGESFSSKYTPKQLVLALRESSKHPDVRMLFKSAGLTDVEELEALRFQNEQIHRILKATNDSKKKSNGTDDIRSYEQALYSAMAESPVSSNYTGTVPSMASRARLFRDNPKRTALRGMGRGKHHWKNMRENYNVSFSRVLKRRRYQFN
jgi:hypothetical protein